MQGTLYGYQRKAVQELMGGKHILVAPVGTGKGAVAVKWLERKCAQTGKQKVLVITTASKARTTDFEDDVKRWCAPTFLPSLKVFTVISWHKLARWVNANWGTLGEYVVVADECQRCGAGASSQMGRAFLKLAKHNPSWAGFTATPGDTWLKFYPYFQACGLVRNKTQFLNTFAVVQTFKGFPEIVEWRSEERLKNMWASVSHSTDAHEALAELPPKQHRVVEFKRSRAYIRTLKERVNDEGEPLDTAGALCAELRRQCFTKEKQEWVRDWAEGLGDGAVVFYNFIKTGDQLEEIFKKALPKGTRVWRIDGTHHEIPTAETIGKQDIVLCQWQSGSEALNLQFLHYWLSVEPHYSYTTSTQARGRVDRIGQTHPIVYWYLITEQSIETAVYAALRAKSDFAQDVWCVENNLTKEGD